MSRTAGLRQRATTFAGAAEALRDRVAEAALDRSRGDGALVAVAAAVGIGTGVLAIALVSGIRLVKALAWGGAPTRWHVLLVPALGGLVVGALRQIRVATPHDSGVTAVMRAIALHAGRIPPLGTLLKGASTVVAISTGAAGGREGPMVLLGSMVGSASGRWLSLDEERVRSLIAAGAASGIAASFNAPIGGMLFAMEVIIGGFKVRSLQVVVVAAVLASVISRQFLGEELVYSIERTYELIDPRELVLYAVLGLLAVLVARAFLRTQERVEGWFARLTIPPVLVPAVGGLGLSVILLGYPEVVSNGHDIPALPGLAPDVGTDPIRAFIEGAPGVGLGAAAFLGILVVVKVLASSISIGSGAPVGELAPTLFIGASLGGAVGHVAATTFAGEVVEPGAYALVGMAAMFGAMAKAPLTGILLVFELTSDYGLVLPLMLATGVATFLADRMWEGSVYTRQLRRDGVLYAEPEDIDVLQTVTVGEVMTTDPDTLQADASVLELSDRLSEAGYHGYPVVDADGRLVGVVTRSDLDRLGDRDPATTTVAAIATTQVSTVTPDDPVFRAVRRMAALNVGRIPVVAAADRGQLVGLVRRADLVEAYQRAITRSLGVQQRKDRSRLRELADARFAEVVVAAGSRADGTAIAEVRWPRGTLITTVRRLGESITPTGATTFTAGDEVVFLAPGDAAEEVRRLLVDPVEDGEAAVAEGAAEADTSGGAGTDGSAPAT